MRGPIREVDMESRYEGGEYRVVVTTPGRYFGHYVNCSKELRGQHEKFRGYVAGNTKSDAKQPFAILVDRRGGRSIEGFTRMGKRADVWPPPSDIDIPLVFRDEPESFHGLALKVYEDLRSQKTLANSIEHLAMRIRINDFHIFIQDNGFLYRFKLTDYTFTQPRYGKRLKGTHYFEVRMEMYPTKNGSKTMNHVRSVAKSDFESTFEEDWRNDILQYLEICQTNQQKGNKLTGKRKHFMQLITDLGGESRFYRYIYFF